jgi:nitrate/nitrite-specific signal transduction histidine kinase
VAGFGSVWSRLCTGEPIIIPDVYADGTEAQVFRALGGEESLRTALSFIRTCMWVPLVVRDHLIGLLSITSSEPDGYTSRDAQLALAIARQAAVGIENARLHERARRSTRRLEERTRELELLYRADATLYRSLRIEDVLQALVEEATGLLGADKATVLVWDSAHERLVPGAARGFLDETLQQMRHGLGEGITGGVARLSGDQEQELYRLAQEALNNVVKRARATGVRVRLDLTDNPSVLEVCDDGSGFEPSQVDGAGYGLRGMQERAERLGATLNVLSAPGAGTRVSVAVPR